MILQILTLTAVIKSVLLRAILIRFITQLTLKHRQKELTNKQIKKVNVEHPSETIKVQLSNFINLEGKKSDELGGDK